MSTPNSSSTDNSINNEITMTNNSSLNGHSPVAPQVTEPSTAEEGANNSVAVGVTSSSTTTNNQTQGNTDMTAPTPAQVSSPVELVKAAQEKHGVDLIRQSEGNSSGTVVRYPVTSDECRIENLVSETLRKEFNFTKGLSEFLPGRPINAAGMFMAIVAMKVNYAHNPNSATSTSKGYMDQLVPLRPSVVDTIIGKDNDKDVKSNEKDEKGKYKPNYLLGHEDNLLVTRPHGLLSLPFAKLSDQTPDGYDYERGFFIPGFTLERRRSMLILAAKIVLNIDGFGNPTNVFSVEVIQIAQDVINNGPETIPYQDGNDQQSKLLFATRLLDNSKEVYLSGLFAKDVNADAELGNRLNESRSILADRFHRIALAGNIVQDEPALFCIVGYYNQFFMRKEAEDSMYMPTVAIRTFTEVMNNAMPVGFCVGVKALTKSQQQVSHDEIFGGGSMKIQAQFGVRETIVLTPAHFNNKWNETAPIEAKRLEEVNALLKEQGFESSKAASVALTSTTAKEVGVAPKSLASKQELAKKELVFDANVRAVQLYITYAGCLMGLGDTEHQVYKNVAAAVDKVSAQPADKAKTLADLNRTATKFFNHEANASFFIKAYNAALAADVDVAAVYEAYVAALGITKPEALVNYIKQVMVALTLGTSYSEEPAKSAALTLGKEFGTDFFGMVQAGAPVEVAAHTTFIELQRRSREKVANTTISSLIDQFLVAFYGDEDFKATREQALAKVNERLVAQVSPTPAEAKEPTPVAATPEAKEAPAEKPAATPNNLKAMLAKKLADKNLAAGQPELNGNDGFSN